MARCTYRYIQIHAMIHSYLYLCIYRDPHLHTFVLSEIDSKVKLMKDGYTEPSPQVLAKMSLFDQIPVNELVWWRAAIVKAMITSGETNRKGESKYFSPNDITEMLFGKWKEFVTQVNEIMEKGASGFEQTDV